MGITVGCATVSPLGAILIGTIAGVLVVGSVVFIDKVLHIDDPVDAIIDGARTGNIGDGKIFVLDLPECIRIRTGEKGKEAVG